MFDFQYQHLNVIIWSHRYNTKKCISPLDSINAFIKAFIPNIAGVSCLLASLTTQKRAPKEYFERPFASYI